MNRKSGAAARSLSAQSFTEKQGHYLTFIYTYSHMFRRPPAETDMQRHFQVSPPSVHQMIVTLERNGLICRQPGVARSIQILFAPENFTSEVKKFRCSRPFENVRQRSRDTQKPL